VNAWNLRSMAVEPHQPEVLHTESEGRSILIHLPAGEQLQEHEVHERAWLVVVDGAVELSDGDDAKPAEAGTLAIFDPKERHEVTATTDARLLLILAPWPGEGHPSQGAGSS
jgi:redox-sensitive bicupin YhaK (pirin superfamily)